MTVFHRFLAALALVRRGELLYTATYDRKSRVPIPGDLTATRSWSPAIRSRYMSFVRRMVGDGGPPRRADR